MGDFWGDGCWAVEICFYADGNSRTGVARFAVAQFATNKHTSAYSKTANDTGTQDHWIGDPKELGSRRQVPHFFYHMKQLFQSDI